LIDRLPIQIANLANLNSVITHSLRVLIMIGTDALLSQGKNGEIAGGKNFTGYRAKRLLHGTIFGAYLLLYCIVII
jgi:hypothetical protein